VRAAVLSEVALILPDISAATTEFVHRAIPITSAKWHFSLVWFTRVLMDFITAAYQISPK